MKYFTHFLLGASPFVSFPFYFAVNMLDTANNKVPIDNKVSIDNKIISKKLNYSYYFYTIVAPLWLGLWYVISMFVGDYFKLSKHIRFLLLSLVTYLLSIIIVKTQKTYNFTEKEWRKYYIGLLILHVFTWNITVYYLENLL